MKKKRNGGLAIAVIAAVGGAIALSGGGGDYVAPPRRRGIRRRRGQVPVDDGDAERGGGDSGDLDEPTVADGLSILAQSTRSEPTQGYLYQVVQGDSPGGVAARALGVPHGDPAVAPYLRCMVNIRWNWFLSATSAPEGAYYAVEREGVWGQIGAAFLPVNESVAGAVGVGRLPQRLIRWTRGPNGEVFALSELANNIVGARTWARIFLPVWPSCDFNGKTSNPSALLAAFGSSPSEFEG